MEMLKLKSMDGEQCQIKRKAADRYNSLKEHLSDPEVDKKEFPKSVKGNLLKKAIEWAEFHHEFEEEKKKVADNQEAVTALQNSLDEKKEAFLNQFSKNSNTLFEITRAGDELKFEDLRDACCTRIAEKISEAKDAPGIRQYLGLDDALATAIAPVTAAPSSSATMN